MLLWAFALLASPAAALENVDFSLDNRDEALRAELKDASLVQSLFKDGSDNAREVFAAALADYARLLQTLYANGYYGGVIEIRLDGREAAAIPLLSAPQSVRVVRVNIRPGPKFTFGRTAIAPLASGSSLPETFARGEPARSAEVSRAVQSAVTSWREAGYAKAAPSAQSIIADHPGRRLDVQVRLDPGPVVRFGTLIQTTPSAVRASAIRRIAGLPKGEVFSPRELERVATRLRRTGAFSSVALREAETLDAGGQMDIELAVADEKPRRYGFGAEVSSLDGLALSGFWLHRNIFGGAERLRVEGEVSNIGIDGADIDYGLGARLQWPARLGLDTTLFVTARYDYADEPDFTSEKTSVGIGASRIFTDRLEGEAGLAYVTDETQDDLGRRSFTLLTFPVSLTYDRRDNPLDPRGGFFIAADATPFVALSGGQSGARALVDARAYRGFGAEGRIVAAGRLQFGSILGADLTEVPPDFLFYSGGGGTVRGQPYQSLDVRLGGGNRIGGRSFVGLSGELRAGVTDTIAGVAFVDTGYIGPESLYDGSGNWHTGAGIGLRYLTGIGPLRLDVAGPVSGGTGAGVQVYIGIGQAF